MEAISNPIIFYALGAVIVVSSILAVTARRMLHAATYLLFVLVGTAGLYLMLNYHFLMVVQLSVYAGGILALFIFAILLTSVRGDKIEPSDKRRTISGIITTLTGGVICIFVVMKHRFLYADNTTVMGDQEINMKDIGHALMGTEKYQNLLPFELLGLFLLACAIGGILIARKR